MPDTFDNCDWVVCVVCPLFWHRRLIINTTMSLLWKGSTLLRLEKVGISYSNLYLWGPVMFFWDTKKMVCSSSFKLYNMCFKFIVSDIIRTVVSLIKISKGNTRSNKNLTMNQRQLRKNWCNKQRGRCRGMTSFSSTSPMSLQVKLCKASVRWRRPQIQRWQFWWQIDSNYTCTSRSIKVGLLTGQTNSNIHQFTGNMTGKRQNLVCHINIDLAPYTIFMPYFAAFLILSVEETDWCYQ
jgi:hypothetical protein